MTTRVLLSFALILLHLPCGAKSKQVIHTDLPRSVWNKMVGSLQKSKSVNELMEQFDSKNQGLAFWKPKLLPLGKSPVGLDKLSAEKIILRFDKLMLPVEFVPSKGHFELSLKINNKPVEFALNESSETILEKVKAVLPNSAPSVWIMTVVPSAWAALPGVAEYVSMWIDSSEDQQIDEERIEGVELCERIRKVGRIPPRENCRSSRPCDTGKDCDSKHTQYCIDKMKEDLCFEAGLSAYLAQSNPYMKDDLEIKGQACFKAIIRSPENLNEYCKNGPLTGSELAATQSFLFSADSKVKESGAGE